MIDLLVATVAFTLVVAVVLVVAVAVTVAPMYAALQMADTRRFSTTRWGLLTATCVLVGLALAYVLHGRDVPEVLAALPLVLTWAGPSVLWLLDEKSERVGGRAGRHE